MKLKEIKLKFFILAIAICVIVGSMLVYVFGYRNPVPQAIGTIIQTEMGLKMDFSQEILPQQSSAVEYIPS